MFAPCISSIKTLLNRYELDPSVCDVFDSASALELNPEVVTLTPGTPCIFFIFKGQAVRKVRNLLVTSVIVYIEGLYLT